MIEIFRIEVGRIAGQRRQTDTLAVLTQLGVLPEPDVRGGEPAGPQGYDGPDD